MAAPATQRSDVGWGAFADLGCQADEELAWRRDQFNTLMPDNEGKIDDGKGRTASRCAAANQGGFAGCFAVRVAARMRRYLAVLVSGAILMHGIFGRSYRRRDLRSWNRQSMAMRHRP